MSKEPSSPLDDILDEYFNQTGEGWNGNGKAAIKSLMVEIIGSDDKVAHFESGADVISKVRNQVRQELRRKIDQL